MGEVGVRIYGFCTFQDWKLEGVFTFFELIYSKLPRGEGDDTLNWQLSWKGVFEVRSY